MCNGTEGNKRMEVGKVSQKDPGGRLERSLTLDIRNMLARSGPMY